MAKLFVRKLGKIVSRKVDLKEVVKHYMRHLLATPEGQKRLTSVLPILPHFSVNQFLGWTESQKDKLKFDLEELGDALTDLVREGKLEVEVAESAEKDNPMILHFFRISVL